MAKAVMAAIRRNNENEKYQQWQQSSKAIMANVMAKTEIIMQWLSMAAIIIIINEKINNGVMKKRK